MKEYRIPDAQTEGGFTIAELAIVMIVFGLFAGVLLYALQIYYRQSDLDRTREALVYSQAAALEFRSLKGRYPCPADPSLSPTDVGYGVEKCTPSPGGVKEANGRDADADGTPDKVLIGAIPFATLLDPDGNPATHDGIDQTPYVEAMTLDGWSRKLTYAVTTNLTSMGSYADSKGAIEIVDEHDNTLLGRPGTSHMVIVSHGENGRGAYTRAGKPVDSCAPVIIVPPPPPPPVPVNELENCDGDGKFLSGLRIEDRQAHNDDFTQFLMTRITALWAYTGVDPATGLPQVANTNSGNVGVGIDAPVQRLDVNGDIKASEARAAAYCDGTGADCMTSSAIAGNEPAMRCKEGFNAAVTSVANSAVNCAQVFQNDLGKCPPNQYAVGISNVKRNGRYLLCAPRQ